MSDFFSTDDVTESTRLMHTPSNFARQNLLYMQEVGILKSLKPHRCVRESLDSFLFVVVLDGAGMIKVKDREYEVSKGCWAFVDCYDHFEHESSENKPWKLGWVHFNGVSAKPYYELFVNSSVDKCNVFQSNDAKKWNEIILHIMKAQEESATENELHTCEYLLHLLNLMIVEKISKGSQQKLDEKELAKNIREFLNERYSCKEIMQEIEKKFGEKVPKLDIFFRRYFGIGIDEYISNRRINAAKEMLRFSVKPIENIAVESGMGDVVTIQQAFRQTEGMSCEEYRSKWAAWIRN